MVARRAQTVGQETPLRTYLNDTSSRYFRRSAKPRLAGTSDHAGHPSAHDTNGLWETGRPSEVAVSEFTTNIYSVANLAISRSMTTLSTPAKLSVCLTSSKPTCLCSKTRAHAYLRYDNVGILTHRDALHALHASPAISMVLADVCLLLPFSWRACHDTSFRELDGDRIPYYRSSL